MNCYYCNYFIYIYFFFHANKQTQTPYNVRISTFHFNVLQEHSFVFIGDRKSLDFTPKLLCITDKRQQHDRFANFADICKASQTNGKP